VSYETFITKEFRKSSLAIIDQADAIIRAYQSDGYTLTLRQLYYQFVSRDLIPNNDKEYKKLGSVIADARLAGLLPWDGIEDRGRSMNGWLVEEDIDTILEDLPYAYAADRWADQDRYIEVWVEKEALASVVERAVRPMRVGYMACKGYLSVSEAYRAGKRMEAARDAGKEPLVIHLGDHDPSGLDMTRDNRDRLEILSYGEVEVQRIALNRDQIDQYSPPPNPAKITDSRAADYIARHGRTSWELDALEPAVLVGLIRDAIRPHIDPGPWDEAEERERTERARLRGVREHWHEVSDLIDSLNDTDL
jgi:hypothetical protein